MRPDKTFRPNQEQLDKIYSMSSNGMTQAQIGGYFRVSEKTFQRMKKKYPEIQKYLDDGRFSGIDYITGKLRALIDAGNVPATIFACKTIGRMREVDRAGENNNLQAAQKPIRIDVRIMQPADAAKVYKKVMNGEYTHKE